MKSTHTLDVRVEPVILMKFAPASVASALARSVFPVPGGPKSNIPLQGWQNHWNVTLESTSFVKNEQRKKKENTRNKFPLEKSSGLLIGRITSSFNAFFTFSRAPISSNLTPISPGGTTAEIKLLSYSSFAMFYHNVKISYFYGLKWIWEPVMLWSFSQGTITFRFWEGFREISSSSLNLEIAISRLW